MIIKSIFHLLWKTVKALLILSAVLTASIVAFLYLAPTFGANPSGKSLKKIEASPNYKNGRFANLKATELSTRDPDEPIEIATYFFPADGKKPISPLPSEKFNSTSLTPGSFAWLGHSTIIFKTASLVVLTDPVFNRASPVPLIGKPFAIQHEPQIMSLPKIDVVIISHDHYDHLDHLAIAKLEPATTQFLVPLGIAAHLQRWGVPQSKIIEFDWYDTTTVGDTEFTLTPARHFSGRGMTNRFKTLWGSWVVKSPTVNLFFSGDTGYFEELKKIGTDYGPFDIAFMENGAYSKDWTQIHLMPEESVQSALDLQSKIYLPIHWGKFDLAQHNWKDPITRATQKAQALGVTITTPVIGEVFTLNKLPQQNWWTNVE